MKAKIIEINGRLYMTVGGVIQHECDEKGNRKEKIMFEKEAKEWTNKMYPCDGQAQRYLLMGAMFGYNKANEWHYVKDGKYPTDEKDVEVLYQDCDKINVYNCVYDIHAENWLYYNLDDMVLELFPFNVIAWKEIVLPKEIK